MSLYLVVLLVSIALAMSLALGAPGTPPIPVLDSTPRSQLPATVPGLTRQEGVFLITTADDGSSAVYFIAQNTRHSIASSDLQLEQILNPLWPVRSVGRDEVLAFPEAAPIGQARTGLIKIEVDATAEAAPETAADASSPVAEVPSPVAEDMGSPVAEDMASPVAEAPSPVAEVAIPVIDLTSPMASIPASPMPHAPAAPQNIPATVSPASAQSPLDLQPTNSEPSMYVIQSGDNLIRLSARFGITVQSILAVNGIPNPNRVYVGQSLVIPAKADVVESPTAPAPIANDAPDQVADAPNNEAATTYTVKRGDSAITIARQLGVDVNDLLAVNAVFNRNRVYVGQVLTIPGA